RRYFDLNGDMVQQFTPIILDYAYQKGGEAVMNILKEGCDTKVEGTEAEGLKIARGCSCC
ncbi:MAG: hypothetical protein KAI75_06320, partial [Desulfobulbaceae bacterium]|nr:hypothetical protein [Desulfobulbaceae bacterium]